MRKPHNKLSTTIESSVLKHYGERSLSLKKIAILHKIHESTVKKIVARAKIKRRPSLNIKYLNKNHEYFDNIDTEAKAYFMGLLWADGHNDTKRGRVQLTLNVKDLNVVNKLGKEILDKTEDAAIYTTYSPYAKSKTSTHADICISSKHMSQVLLSYGMTPNKSFSVIFPTVIPNELMHHFIRGYSDGDGWVSIYERKYKNKITYRYEWGIMGSTIFCDVCKKNLSNNITGHIGQQTLLQASQPMSRLRATSPFVVLRILDFLYKDATIFMQRKYEIYPKLQKSIIKMKDRKSSAKIKEAGEILAASFPKLQTVAV